MTEVDAEAVEKLWMDLLKDRAHLDAECTADVVEQEAAWGEEAMGNFPITTGLMVRICTKWKRRWNAEIRERRKAVGREKKMRWNSDEVARATAKLNKFIQQSQRKMWSEFFQNMKDAEKRRVARYMIPRATHDHGGLEKRRMTTKQTHHWKTRRC
jgi:hypothetical protein